ncbi:MAG TPA: hypothetical protein VFP76_05965 [Gemmatimonadota bacterium]|nr:hypothetical protein [Gemmatimonadota bacterium]
MTRSVPYFAALLLAGALLGPAPGGYAQQAVDEPTTGVAGSEEAQRRAVLSALDRAEVRRVATTAGLDLEAARANVRLLEGERLDRAAGQARVLEERAQFGTISSTTLVILLLITILLIVVIQS